MHGAVARAEGVVQEGVEDVGFAHARQLRRVGLVGHLVRVRVRVRVRARVRVRVGVRVRPCYSG